MRWRSLDSAYVTNEPSPARAPSTDVLWEALGDLLRTAEKPPHAAEAQERSPSATESVQPPSGLMSASRAARVHVSRRGSVEVAYTPSAAQPLGTPPWRCPAPTKVESPSPVAAQAPAPAPAQAPAPAPVVSSAAYALQQIRQAVLAEQVAELRKQHLRDAARTRGIGWVSQLDSRMRPVGAKSGSGDDV